jgi:hypothetical protein
MFTLLCTSVPQNKILLHIYDSPRKVSATHIHTAAPVPYRPKDQPHIYTQPPQCQKGPRISHTDIHTHTHTAALVTDRIKVQPHRHPHTHTHTDSCRSTIIL